VKVEDLEMWNEIGNPYVLKYPSVLPKTSRRGKHLYIIINHIFHSRWQGLVGADKS